MNEAQKQLYSYLKDNGLTDLSADKFFSAYSDPSKSKEIHAYLKQQGLTDLDANAFHVAYFKKKSTTGSQSVQKKKPTSSVTPVSWMQESLVSSSSQGQKNKTTTTSTTLKPVAPKKETVVEQVISGKEQTRMNNGVLERLQNGIWVPVSSGGSEIGNISKSIQQSRKEDAHIFTGYPGKEKNEYRVYNDVWQRRQPGKTEWTTIINEGSINALNKQFNQEVKIGSNINVQLRSDAERKELDNRLANVNSRLIDKEEDEVVKELRRQFPNFKFIPQGTFTDEMIVLSPDGNDKIKISLDNWTFDDDRSEAVNLREFIRKNSNNDLNEADKKVRAAEKDMEYFTVKPFYPTIQIGDGYGDEKIITDPSQISTEPKQKMSIITADQNLKAATKEYAKEYANAFLDVQERARISAKTEGKLDDKEVASAYASLDHDVRTARIADRYFQDVSAQSKELKKQFSDYSLWVDSINERAKSGEISKEEYENTYVPQMKEELDRLKGMSEKLNDEYSTSNNMLKSIEKATAENYIIQESKGSVAGGIAYNFTKGLTDIARIATLGNFDAKDQEAIVRLIVGEGTTKEYMSSENRSDLTKVLFSLATSLGQATSGGIIGRSVSAIGGGTKAVLAAETLPFYSGGYYEMKDQFDDPKFKNISDFEKVMYSTLYGVTSGILEKYGLTKSISKTPFGKSLTASILSSTIKGLPKDASEQMIKDAIESSVLNKLKSAGVNTLGAFVVEASTESAQKVTELALQETFDWIHGNKKEGYDKFKNGTWKDMFVNTLYEGYLGGLGGGMMQIASSSISGITNGITKTLNKDQIQVLDNMVKINGIADSYDSYLKGLVVNGDLTPDEAREMSSSFREVKGNFDKIPDNISPEEKAKAFDLMTERSKIEKEITGKDESLVAPQKARIAEINNELTKISENATKKSTEQQQEGTAEGGVVQREGVVEGQPEVGKGEGTVGQATEQGTDLGNRPVEGRSKEEIDARVSELESMLANDAASFEETGIGSLLPEAKTQIQNELEALKSEVPVEAATETVKETPKAVETTDTKAYSDALAEAKAQMKADGTGLDMQVSDVSQEEADAIIAEGGKVFMTEDGMAGAYVKKDGYMGGLFKNPRAKMREIGKLLQQARVKVGGKFMDAYATKLEDIYIKNGFRPVARLKFNEEYAPEGWDAPGSPLASKPDVVFFVYDPLGKYKKGDGEYMTDYDAAYEMAKNFDTKTANEADRLAAILDKKAEVSKDVISKEDVNKRVSLAQKALNLILPDVKFIVHDTDEAFRKAVGEVNTKDSSAGAYDMGNKVIHINGTKANKRTVSHEVFHAIIISKASSDKQLQKLTANMVSSVLKSLKQTGTNQDVIDYLERFAAEYKDDPTVMNEERLAELHGILGENMIELPLPTQNIIKRFLDRIAKMFGLKEMTDREAVEFMNTMSSKVETGKEITVIEFNAKNQKPGGESFVGTVNVTRKSKGIPAPSVKDDSRDFIRDFVKDIDIREFNGEKFVTNMYDYTNAGKTDLGNGLIIDLFGGKNYVPYMMSINNKKIGDVSNLAAFNTKAQAETFIRNSQNGNAHLFAPHSGTKSQSWQFQQHTFAELVNLIIENKLLTNAELISAFNKTIEGNAALKDTFNKFKKKYGKNIKDFGSFKSNPMQIVDLLDIKNNLSPDLRKALNNAIASDKKFQQALGIKNKEEFYNRIMDPLNIGVEGGEIMGVVDFDPNTFEIVQTSPNDTDHHPSFGWTLMAKINGIYQPTEFHKSSDITDTYTKYNIKGPDVSIKENEPNFEQKNVSSSAGAIPKVAEFNIRKQKPLQPEVAEKLTEDGKGNYVFNHYSDKKRDVIKPGTGQNMITSREEASALSAVNGLAQYYTMDMQKEPGTGPNQHTILIPKDRVYYFNKDQEGFYDEAKKRFEKVRPGQAFNPNYQVAFITQVANENGYDMVVANWRNGELRAQTTMELTPSDKIINFKPLKEVTYEVGDTVQIYGDIVKITAIDGDTLTYKNERTSGDFNFKRSPKSIQKVATPKEQVEEEVKSLDEEMKPKMRKQRVDKASEKLQQLFERDNVPLSIQEAKDIVNEVYDWTTWYDDLKSYVDGIFEEYAEDVLSMLPLSSQAANSATTVALAIKNAELIYQGEKPVGVAEYYGYVTDFLQGKGIKSDKMYNFFKALDGDKDAIAVDMHVWSIIMGKNPDKKQVNPKNQAEFDRAKEFINTLATEMNLAPREVQAALWAANIMRTGGRPDSYEEYFKKQLDAKGLKERIETWRNEGYKPFSKIRREREAENKSKFRKQKASDQAAVIVKTGKEAGLSDAGIREYMKRNGYTDRQAIDAIQAYNDKKEGIFIDPEWSSLRKAAVLFKRKFLSARGLMPNSSFALNENRQADIAKSLNMAEKNIVDFNRALKKVPKDQRDKIREDFDAYIRDKSAILPAEFKKIADKMRAHIDSISKDLIVSGLIDEHLSERVIDNIGSYLTRSYKVYDRKNWKKEVEEEIKQKAINFLKVQYTPMAKDIAAKEGMDFEDVLDRIVTSKFNEILTKEGAENFITGGKIGSKNLSILKERQDIPLEIRMLMGEYTDPAQNYAKTILKMSALAANHHFLTEVKKNGTGVFLFEKNDPRRPKGFDYMIAAEGSDTMNPLNGMYTTKEIKEEFEKQPAQLGTMMETYMRALSLVKWGKTIGSIMTHAKNVFGNLGFVLLNGHWRVNEMGRAYKTVKNDLFSRDKAGLRDYMNKLIELGIVKQSAGIGELRAMFKDADWDTAMIERINKKTGSGWDWVKSKFAKGTKFMEDLYQSEDDFFKIVAYENELSRYSKAMFGKSKNELTEDERSEVDKIVSEIVKNTYPTYSRIPELVNIIRRLPFVGNFISFQAESYRTAFNTAALSLDEIKSENPGVRQIGAQRLVGSLVYMGGKTAILSMVSNAVGMGAVGILGYFTDDEEEKKKEDDVRKFVAPWSKNSDLIVLKASNGKIQYIDFSSSDPHGGINKAINSALMGENTVDGFINALGSVIEPFIGEEMTTAAILAVKNNKNAYGKPIYNPEDTFFEKSKDISAYMLNVVQPGTVSSARKMYESDNKLNEAVGAATGMRIYDVDVAENFGYSMITYGKRIDDANRIYTSEVYNEDATEKSIAAAKKRAEKAITNIHAEIYGLYYSAVRLGANEDKLYENLKSFGGMSDNSIDYMFAQEEFYIEDKYPEEE